MMFFSVVFTVGNPNEKPLPSTPKVSGSGNTGWAVSPKTRPENHLLVGGTRPSASRSVFRSLPALFTIAPTRGATASWPNTVVEAPLAAGCDGAADVGCGDAGDEQATKDATSPPASTPRNVLLVVAKRLTSIRSW